MMRIVPLLSFCTYAVMCAGVVTAQPSPKYEAVSLRAVEKHRFQLGADVSSVVYSPDSRFLVAVDKKGTIVAWEVDSGREVTRVVFDDFGQFKLAFSPDGKHLAARAESTRTKPTTMKIIDIPSGKENGSVKVAMNLTFYQGNKEITELADGVVTVRNTKDDSVIRKFTIDQFATRFVVHSCRPMER